MINNFEYQQLQSEIKNISDAYDKTSPNYKFNYIFYNLAPFQTQPQNLPSYLYQKAISFAPSKNHTPVVLKGTDELNARIDLQQSVIEKIQTNTAYLYSKHTHLLQKSVGIYKRMVILSEKLGKLRNIEGKYHRSNEFLNELAAIKIVMQKLEHHKQLCFTNMKDISTLLWNYKLIGEKIAENINSRKN